LRGGALENVIDARFDERFEIFAVSSLFLLVTDRARILKLFRIGSGGRFGDNEVSPMVRNAVEEHVTARHDSVGTW